VTGGASGIGEAICRRLLAEGASVVAGDVNSDRLELLGAELGEKFHGVRADVRYEADVSHLVAQASRFGPLDCGFNVAGLGGGRPIIEQSQDDWDFVLSVCLTGVFLAMKHEGKLLTKCGALEMAGHGIRVNAVSPGLTDTPLTAMVSQIPGILDAYKERIPLKRAATPDEIAAAALCLASDDASYVSGVNLFVDGAWATTGYPDLRPYLAAAAAGGGHG